jgi:hypothetical protein
MITRQRKIAEMTIEEKTDLNTACDFLAAELGFCFSKGVEMLKEAVDTATNQKACTELFNSLLALKRIECFEQLEQADLVTIAIRYGMPMRKLYRYEQFNR